MIDSTHVIALEPVTSSNLSAYGYDEAAQTAAVQFRSGHIFHYPGVPIYMWEAWQAAPSKGSFYAHEIKRRFSGEKVTGECPNCADIGMKGERCTDCGTAEYRLVILK